MRYLPRTLGGVLTLYAPRDADGRELPVDLDRRLLEDVRALVQRVAELLGTLALDFGFELDQDPVGWIQNGQPDNSLTDGLIGEWARVISSR